MLVNLGKSAGFDIAPWTDRVRLIDAKYGGRWELPVIGEVSAPAAVLFRPDGYVARVGDLTQRGLTDTLTHLVRTGEAARVAHRAQHEACTIKGRS